MEVKVIDVSAFYARIYSRIKLVCPDHSDIFNNLFGSVFANIGQRVDR